MLDLATKTELKLISTLKQYFPLAVHLFNDVGMKSDIALSFLSRWPTLDELQRAKAHTVRSFFYAHNSRSQSLIEKRLQQIAQAHPVTDDLALIEELLLTTKCLVAQLRFGERFSSKRSFTIRRAEGCPVGVEVFDGKTQDASTVPEKIAQLQRLYGLKEIIFVGDRGMITKLHGEQKRKRD